MKKKYSIQGMTCLSCALKIEKIVKQIQGVKKVDVNYVDETLELEVNENIFSEDTMIQRLKENGYSIGKPSLFSRIIWIILVFGILYFTLNPKSFNMEQTLRNASLGILFMVGLFTSIHCVGMCGGIMLSQSIHQKKTVYSSIQYNVGRLIAYTTLGGIVGAIGTVFELNMYLKSMLLIVVSLFMLLTGLNIIGFSPFRRMAVHLPKINTNGKGPFVVGLFNGFMPCGPLQTMQLYALATGSWYEGALSMFFFSLGTIPLMLTFGILSSYLSKRNRVQVYKVSGILMITLSLIMGTRAFSLSGITVPFIDEISFLSNKGEDLHGPAIAKIEDGVQIIEMDVTNDGYSPSLFYVQKDLPIRWIIHGKQLNSCNNEIMIPNKNIQQKLKEGTNIIDIPPLQENTHFSCWMGMITGNFKVVDDLSQFNLSLERIEIPNQPKCILK